MKEDVRGEVRMKSCGVDLNNSKWTSSRCLPLNDSVKKIFGSNLARQLLISLAKLQF